MSLGQRMVILSTLYSTDRTALDIIETARQATKGKVRIPQGSIYTQLDRLEKAGLIAVRPMTEPARRLRSGSSSLAASWRRSRSATC